MTPGSSGSSGVAVANQDQKQQPKCGVMSYQDGPCDRPKGHPGDHVVEADPPWVSNARIGRYRWKNRRKGAYE